MSSRIILGLVTLAALIEGLAPGAVPSDLLPLALVILGLIYGAMMIDAEEPTTFLAVVIATGASAQADVLNNIQMIGWRLDNIVDQFAIMLYGGAVGVMVMRLLGRLKG